MDAGYFMTVAREAMWVLALVAAPILIPALVSGLILTGWLREGRPGKAAPMAPTMPG